MTEIHSPSPRTGDSWTGSPSRAAGLYGELPPLPVPAATPVFSTQARKPRPRAGLTD